MEFLIDENVLGLARHLDTLDINYCKIGDDDCPEKGSKDPIVAKFAKEKGLIIVTNDDKLTKQCELLDVDFVFNDLRDFAKKIQEYATSH